MTEILEQYSTISAFFFMSSLLLGKMANFISYTVIKARIISGQQWDLNICCGKTGAGTINADIIRHAQVPNFVLINDIYRLPFADRQFRKVLCSHTIEHVEQPELFYKELCRVGESVTIILPPLWDILPRSIFWNINGFFDDTQNASFPARISTPSVCPQDPPISWSAVQGLKTLSTSFLSVEKTGTGNAGMGFFGLFFRSAGLSARSSTGSPFLSPAVSSSMATLTVIRGRFRFLPSRSMAARQVISSAVRERCLSNM